MNFYRLVAPVFVAVAISIAAFMAVVFVAATLQDKTALRTERQVLEQDLKSLHATISAMAEDNAWWDESVKHIILEEDIDWIDRTVGDSVNGIANLHGVVVLRHTGELIYSNYVEDIPSPHALIDQGLGQLMSTFPEPDQNQASSQSGFLMVEDQLLAFGASLVQPSGFEEFETDILQAPLPAIIFISRLTPERLLEIGQSNAIEELALTTPDTGSPVALLALQDTIGNIAATITWRTSAPGSRMIEKITLPAIILLLVVALAMTRFLRQANRLVEELDKANKAKSAFLASTSHEIRTPLNAIIGFTELMSLELYGKVEGKKNKEYLNLIQESGEHLLSIINDILDISKLEAERFEVYAEKVCPVHVVGASQKIVQQQASEKNIEITSDCEIAELLSDERIMRQIMINLLSNSVKFTKPGGAVAVTGKISGKYYQIKVEDNGIGMSEAELAKALTLFGQVQSEYARDHSGTGLGLPLVNRFMELLGGKFTIKSTPGEGTCVTLDFPLYSTKN